MTDEMIRYSRRQLHKLGSSIDKKMFSIIKNTPNR